METLNLSNLKAKLESFKEVLHEQDQIDFVDSIINEIISLENSGLISEQIKINLSFRTTDVVHRILIELIKHAAAGETLHLLYEFLKKFGD